MKVKMRSTEKRLMKEVLGRILKLLEQEQLFVVLRMNSNE